MSIAKAKPLEKTEEKTLPIVISARTGLTPAGDALMRTLPRSYSGKTVKEALDYLLKNKSLDFDEASLAKSLGKEMRSEEFVVVVNGENAELTDKITDYLVRKEHKLPNKQVKPYRALEIEVSSVQEGGFYRPY